MLYVQIMVRYKEHTRYINHNDPQSTYAFHILNNRHECGPITVTMELLQHISNPTMLLPSEQLFIHSHHHHKQHIPEQHIHDINPLYQTILDVYDTSLTQHNKNQYHTETISSSNVAPAGRTR